MDTRDKGSHQQKIQLFRIVKIGQLLHQGMWLTKSQVQQKFPQWGNSTQWIPLPPKGGGLIQEDIGGHPPFHWLKTIISDWQFFGSFSGPKLSGLFEGHKQRFFRHHLGEKRNRSTIYLLLYHFTPRRDLSNGLSNDPNRDRMQKLCPWEFEVPTYHSRLTKMLAFHIILSL